MLSGMMCLSERFEENVFSPSKRNTSTRFFFVEKMKVVFGN